MDILQAQQEIQRLRNMFAAGQLTPEAFTQAVNQLQIVDATGSFWHVDGASLRWYRYEGQSWVERTPPTPPPAYPAQATGPAWTQPGPVTPAGRSMLPLWIGLGVFGLLVIAAAIVFGGGLLAPTPTPVAAASATPALVKASPTPGQAAPSATARPTRPAANLTVEPTVAPADTPTPEAPSAADFLKPEGPWLLLKDNDNVYWLSPDGAQALNTEKVVAPFAVKDMLAPSGGNVAFITSTTPDGLHQLMLTVYNLPLGDVITQIALTSLKTEPGSLDGPGDPSFEALRSITDFTSIAWSPDGRRLAFVGFMDGPSSDLYLYSLDTGEVTRLTDGPSQAFEPTWSPDGAAILQFGANSFGTGAGFSMSGVWATDPTTGVSTSLYTPTSGGESFLGWLDANTFLVYSFSAACGPYNLRAVTLQPPEEQVIFGACFNSVDFDAASQTALIAIDQGTADFCSCGDAVDAGLYLVRMDGSHPRLDSGDYFQAQWIAGAGVAWGRSDKGQAAAFTGDGGPVALPSGVPLQLPLAAPGGEVWAWTVDTIGDEPGLWITRPGGAAPKFSDLPISSAIWTESGDALLFLSGGQLYAAAAPQYEPTPLVAAPDAGLLAWAVP